ncbi:MULTISPECIES: class I SAM-dependent methyltransferase [unclassified Rhodococcus (in: high G+C Gram-positive bacteria)]|uniref:class I SAM-dependent DNA methyltransferase n=1 Tax=unclassified Rhodococcus (in: high G+C Gram-positive bacteria) TaxID=192944 RepID=UPI00163A0B34|nr:MULTISPECIES: class I SAM-dependent methyltransferase [unclassified Rhodococcus (in: high G+C Gram-positive bacteria)]MBC2637999.1 class I SAM-dependent methyltransferase [Rhodococcus sp. 3A]MBC2897254.1 class I SAM-dependent methyltransferase [Rhodococcus sp. 4CII]
MVSAMDPAYFETMYAESADPWGFGERWYERRKYAITLAALPRPRYRRAFEPGCSIGVLTAQLVDRCDRVVATDVVPRALERARHRLEEQGVADRVELGRSSLLDPWPPGTFDLVVLSEVLYYLTPDDLAATLERAVGALEEGGTLVAVHWQHPVPEYPQTGRAVHERIAATDGLVRAGSYADEDFRLDVYTRGAVPSVAAAEGLS